MKKTVTLIALILLLLLTAGLLISHIQGGGLSMDDKDRVQKRFQAYIDDRGFSGVVYAVYGNDVIFDNGAGMATDTLPNGSDIAYGVASLTKQFTAAAIMQLQENGLLSITDPLSQYFPEYRYGDKITIQHLLSQRSGIPDYSVNSEEDKVIVTCYDCPSKIMISPQHSAEVNQKKIRAFFLAQELLFEPGTEFDYSDSNFALLAEIVTRVSGMTYHDYLRKCIFKPLGMEESAFIDDYDPSVITRVAQTDRDEFSMDYFTVRGAEYGCGDILTTPKDLYLWYRGFTSGKVVSKESYRQMTTNYSLPDELGYGYGLMISDKSDSKVIYHYGYIPAYYSSMMFVPEIDYFQVVQSNHADGDPHRLAADLAKYFGSVIDFKFIEIE